MKTVNLGPIKNVDGDLKKYEVPSGARFIIVNPKSGQIQFEVNEHTLFYSDEDFQYLNPNTKRYVKVDFKKTEGPFKGIPRVLPHEF